MKIHVQGAMRVVLLGAILWVGSAWGQQPTNTPAIGYLYPAGGQAGTVTKITVGGQRLRGPKRVHVSGEGVSARVIEFYPPVRNIQKEQRDELMARMTAVRDARLAELRGESRAPAAEPAADPAGDENTTFRPVRHPLLYDLEGKSLRELAHIRTMLFFPREKQQLNSQIAESVLVEVTIDSDAAPGTRELRLETSGGLTNPMVFQVGQFRELSELEPNDPGVNAKLPEPPPLKPPFVMNGQAMPGDADRFKFRANKGQSLVIEASARCLVPYLADAVPGWFQPVVTVYAARGREVAFGDDYRFDPDPVFLFAAPNDGVYEIEIRDSIYRGREDFVYRLSVSERPFITSIFPLGASKDGAAHAKVSGWNLDREHVSLDLATGPDIRMASLEQDGAASNFVAYAIGALPERAEIEPNDSTVAALRISLPQVLNGAIDETGDVDAFRFSGKAGETIVAEVVGRRLGSPLDSLLRLVDTSGTVVAWNDDYTEVESGLNTHHADSYLRAQLPADGEYVVVVSDAQRHGGEAYAYRLRISDPQPDYALRMTPSSLTIQAGRAVPFTVCAFRKDGFEDDIEIALQEPPPGFELSGDRIPAGCDRIRMTLTAPREVPTEPVELRLVGRAWIDGQPVSRPVVPADDMMQAFIYQHLVPAEQLLTLVQGGGGRQPSIELANETPVQIPAGGSAPVHMRLSKGPAAQKIDLTLNDPPEGVTLDNVNVSPEGVDFELKADAATSVLMDNLIVEAFAHLPVRGKDGKPTKQLRRAPAGYLPAIPIEVVAAGG